jgi:hypothetical protein
MSGSVRIGDLFPLEVRVTVEKLLPEALEMLLKVPQGEREIRMTVYVATKGLEIQGDHLGELVVPIDRDSDPIFFRMVARQSGPCSTTIEFVQDGRYLGGVTVETFAYEASGFHVAPSTRGHTPLDFIGWQTKPDTTLFIHEVRRSEGEVRYRFVVDS